MAAFMSRHQEELDSYEIQMGLCHRWLCNVFTLTTRRSLWHLRHNSSQWKQKLQWLFCVFFQICTLLSQDNLFKILREILSYPGFITVKWCHFLNLTAGSTCFNTCISLTIFTLLMAIDQKSHYANILCHPHNIVTGVWSKISSYVILLSTPSLWSPLREKYWIFQKHGLWLVVPWLVD